MAVLGPGLLNLVVALSILGAAGPSRVIRGAALSVMQHPYIEAARAMGAGHLRIVLRYILPNVMATVIVLATIGLGRSSWSNPRCGSWASGCRRRTRVGRDGRGVGSYVHVPRPWMALCPGVAISLAVFGFNMLGDALRDVLDPRLRGGGGRPIS